MFKSTVLSISVMLISALLYAQPQPTFLSNPTLSPDGQTVVFSYEGDLWRVAAAGGSATRLTAMRGNEILPRISPDGKWLAFSADQNGNMDVYVMPIDGGEIRQITHHESSDEVDSWSWDNEHIYFTSGRANRFGSYRVKKAGGTAEPILPHFFNFIHNIVERPTGELLFTDSWESYSAANRKRYKGAFNPDIRGYDPKTEQYRDYTSYIGKDLWPTVDQSGVIYFASDEANEEYNLYKIEGNVKSQLTSFTESIRKPQVAANGTMVVFEKGYQIFLFDTATEKVIKPNIQLSRNKVLGKASAYNVAGKISFFDLSPDGKKMAFVSRGELFISDTDGKFIRKMPSQGERIVEVKWLKDNKTLLYNQTFNGYLNWFTRTANGLDDPKRLTDDKRNNRDIKFNAELSQAVYLSGRDEVRLMDLASLSSETIVKDEIWAFQNSSPSFSPDGDYVLFTAIRNFEQDLFVYHIGTKETLNLTGTGVTEAHPVWSTDGQYIFFVSNRVKPAYPTGMEGASLYRMSLENTDEPFRSEKFDKLFQSSSDLSENDSTDRKGKKKTVVVQIDSEGLSDRIQRVGPSAGTQYNPQVFAKGDKQYLFFQSNHEGKSGVYRIDYEPFSDPKTTKLADGTLSNLIQIGERFYGLKNGRIQKYNLDQNKLEGIDISFAFERNLNDEFSQMFYETWANVEENFYDETFHGVDWEEIKERYARYLPGINNRMDLRVLLNDMLGELNSSHLGFSTSGPEERKDFSFVTSELGVVYSKSEPFRIDRLLANGPATKKGVDLQVGDVIVAVNGVEIDPLVDRDYYFSAPSLMKEMSLTVQRNGEEKKLNIRPQSSADFKTLLYDEWIKANRTKVDVWSDNRIAYSHMKNMGQEELHSFLIDMAEYENNKEGIILDLRYNTGGNVHDEVLKFLSQRPYLQWQYRGGKKAPQSHFAPAGKPIVLLVNEQSLSDAEMTAAGFKALGLGKIVGTETYRWIIFTSGKGLVDGSFYRLPAWGCYTLEGDNLELSGVSPDIEVKNTIADRIKNRDPQLERAVQEIMSDLR